MPQIRELSFLPLNYQAPSYSAAECQAHINTITEHRDSLMQARDILDTVSDRVSLVRLDGAENDELPWFPRDETDLLVYTGLVTTLSQERLRRTTRRRAYSQLRDTLHDRRLDLTAGLTDTNNGLRRWHSSLAVAEQPAPEHVVLRRDELRSQLKGIPQIPLRNVNLATSNGGSYLTWQFRGVFCKPNNTVEEYRIHGINAGDIPAFPLPNMAFTMPLQQFGTIKVKPLRNERRFYAFSSHSVHPHHMPNRTFCLGDYASTIEEVKMKHDFVGIILLLLDFVSKCEPTDAAGRTYVSFIQQQIGMQFDTDGQPQCNVMMNFPPIPRDYLSPDAAHTNRTLTLDFNSQWFLNQNQPRGEDRWHGRLHGRIARLRGQWVFQPCEVHPSLSYAMTRVLSYEETCTMRDSFSNETMRAFFAKDEQEYALLARMCTDNTPIQYNEQTNLVLNTLSADDVHDDDDTWDDNEALASDNPDYESDNQDDEEDTEEYDEEPYVDEPY